MKLVLSVRKCHYSAVVSILLIAAALISGMAGCDGGGYNPLPSQNLEIQTWYDLDAARDNLVGNHTLMNDLDSTTPGYEELASPAADGGKGWEPIGTENSPFIGTFDGQGYEIHDLFINRPGEDYVGLFRSVDEGGIIDNIGVVNVTVNGNKCVGGLVGENDGTVNNSYATGSVTGCFLIGGLVGRNERSVSESYSTGDFTGSLLVSDVGGLVGWNDGTVNNSYSTGTVTGGDHVGGLVGHNVHGTVSNSYATGNVTGKEHVGGLAGRNHNGAINNSYSSGNVTGHNYVGGLVGENQFYGTVNNSFWDTETSGQSTSDGGTGKSTTEMQDIATFSGAGWNIIAVALNQSNPAYTWNIVDNVTYPFLSWQL